MFHKIIPIRHFGLAQVMTCCIWKRDLMAVLSIRVIELRGASNTETLPITYRNNKRSLCWIIIEAMWGRRLFVVDVISSGMMLMSVPRFPLSKVRVENLISRILHTNAMLLITRLACSLQVYTCSHWWECSRRKKNAILMYTAVVLLWNKFGNNNTKYICQIVMHHKIYYRCVFKDDPKRTHQSLWQEMFPEKKLEIVSRLGRWVLCVRYTISALSLPPFQEKQPKCFETNFYN